MNPFNIIGPLSFTLCLTVALPSFAMPLSTGMNVPSSSLLAGSMDRGAFPAGSDRGSPLITSGGGTRLQFPSGSDRGAPVTTSGGGTRGPRVCVKSDTGDLSLNALTPYFSNNATTASSTPTFYYYVPATSAQQGELVITDESDNKIYQTTINLPAQPGIIPVKITPTTPLSADKFYQWSFSLICNPQARDQDFSITGNLEFKPLETPLPSTATPLEQAKFYASKGIWLETLDSIAPYHSQYSEDWTSLLKSAGLEDLINQPLIDNARSKWPVTGEIPDKPPVISPTVKPPLPTVKKDSKIP